MQKLYKVETISQRVKGRTFFRDKIVLETYTVATEYVNECCLQDYLDRDISLGYTNHKVTAIYVRSWERNELEAFMKPIPGLPKL